MQNPSIPQDWNVYFSRIGDAPAALRINLALIEVAPLAEYPQHVRVSMKLEQTNEHGFPTPEERFTTSKTKSTDWRATTTFPQA